MKIFDLTQTTETEFDQLVRLINEAWLYGCITVSEVGGFYDQE